MPITKFRNVVTGGAIAVTLTGVLVALGAGSSSDAVAGSTQSNNQPGGRSYSVLTRPATARDREFSHSWNSVKDTASRTPGLGLDVNGARVVRSDATGTLAVVPAQAAPCLVSGHGDADSHISCGTGDEPVTATISYGSATGVVPDSVESVAFKMTDGTVTNGKVVDNIWNAPPEAATATYVVDGHTVVVDLMPASAMPAGATTDSNGMTSIGKPGADSSGG